MDNEKAIAEKLLQINAIKLSVDKPFIWASGWKSPIYCDNRKALSFPDIRDFIKRVLCDTVAAYYKDAEMIAGVATAGIAWGALVADQLHLPYIYVRPKPKEHGLGNQVEGFIGNGKKVVIIEDLISTGKSSLLVAEVLQRQGLHVNGMVAIFSYDFGAAKTAFDQAKVSLHSLSNYEALIALAIEKNYISPADQNTLLNWRLDPANWGAKL
jgi:orotate phosphoribosyltransferase